jgi:hypothetical protein
MTDVATDPSPEGATVALPGIGMGPQRAAFLE